MLNGACSKRQRLNTVNSLTAVQILACDCNLYRWYVRMLVEIGKRGNGGKGEQEVQDGETTDQCLLEVDTNQISQ